MGLATLSGPVWQWRRKPQEVQWGRKESRRTSETPPGTWHGGAQKGSSGSATQGLWLRNGKMGFQVSGVDRSQFAGRGTVREVKRRGR